MRTALGDFYSNLNVGSAFAALRNQIQEDGYRIIQSSDFDYFAEICAEREGRPISQFNDEKFLDLTRGNSFYLVAYDKDEKVVGTIVSTCETIGRENLAQFMTKRLNRILDDGSLSGIFAPGMYDIRGKIAYQGDLWVDKRSQGKRLGIVLTKLSLLVSLNLFDPDYIYAFFAPRMVKSSRIIEMGFQHAYNNAIDWAVPPTDFNEEFWLAYSTRDDLNRLALSVYSQSS